MQDCKIIYAQKYEEKCMKDTKMKEKHLILKSCNLMLKLLRVKVMEGKSEIPPNIVERSDALYQTEFVEEKCNMPRV